MYQKYLCEKNIMLKKKKKKNVEFIKNWTFISMQKLEKSSIF